METRSEQISDPLLHLEEEVLVRRVSRTPPARGTPVLGIDARWSVAMVSAAAEELLAYPRGRLMGLSAESLAPELRGLALHGFRARALGEDPPPPRRVILRRGDGASISARAAVEPVETAAGPLALIHLSGLRCESDSSSSLS